MEQGANIDSQNMLPIGTTLQGGKYRVDKYLSSGGFGNTYIVTNTKFDEIYAMKEFFMKDVCERDCHYTVSVSNLGNQETFTQQRAKFNKEAQRIRKFDNSHIVKVHDLFDENDTSYYIMDYVDGASLYDRMKSYGKPFKEKDVLQFLPQILDGLEEVHRKNIWHLDLHPKNILLDNNGNIVLIDFGASKQLNPDNRFSTSSAFCYHQGYAPTEQIDQNIAKIGAWTDLYALGATVYNLLTKLSPLSTSEIQDGEEFSYPYPVSDRTKELINWMMQPNRKKRPQSVNEVREFLKIGFKPLTGQNQKVSDDDDTISDDKINVSDDNDKRQDSFIDKKKQRNIYITLFLWGLQAASIYSFIASIVVIYDSIDWIIEDNSWLWRSGMPHLCIGSIVVFIFNGMVIQYIKAGFKYLMSFIMLLQYTFVFYDVELYLMATIPSFIILLLYYAILKIPFKGQSTWSLMKPSKSAWSDALLIVTLLLWAPILIISTLTNANFATVIMVLMALIAFVGIHIYLGRKQIKKTV